jgi:hypothetical protein
MFLLATLTVMVSMCTVCMFFRQQVVECVRAAVYYKQMMCVHLQDDPMHTTTKKVLQALLVVDTSPFALDVTDIIEDMRHIVASVDEWAVLTTSYCDAYMLSPHMLNVPDIRLYLHYEHMSSQCIRVICKNTPFLCHMDDTTPTTPTMKFVDKMTSANLIGPEKRHFDCVDQLLMFAGPRSDFFDDAELTVMHFMRYCAMKCNGYHMIQGDFMFEDSLHVTLRSGATFNLGVDDHLLQIAAKKLV